MGIKQGWHYEVKQCPQLLEKKSKVDTWTSNPLHTNITMRILLTVHLTFAKVLTRRLSAAIYAVKRLEKQQEMHPKYYVSIDVIKMTTF